MEIALQQEELSPELLVEASELMHMHKEELCLHEDFVLDPNYEAYFALAYSGALVVYTAREDGELVGYAAYAVHQNMHYRQVKHAIQDVLFLHPSKRGLMGGVKLINYADEKLADLGVTLVTHHVKMRHDFSPLLERAGYVQSEKLYEKRLD